MKKWLKDNIPQTVTWSRVLKLSVAEKKFAPNMIKLNHSGNKLFANPYENRGAALLLNKGNGQPFIKKYWRTAINFFNPEVALDIGANYGEVFLDTNYKNSIKKIIVVEANAELCKHLKSSIEQHPNKNKIILLNGLASEQKQENIPFYIDKTSSGRSTALVNNFVKKTKLVHVNSYRIDDYVYSLETTIKRLVFKIDVEGFEPYVLKGMEKFLKNSIELIGCIEFNLVSLNKNSINVDEYLNFLNKNFQLVLMKKNGELIPVKAIEKNILKEHFKNQNTEGDILLFSNEKLQTQFINNFHSS